MAAGDHLAPHQLGQVERPFEIEIDDIIEVGLGHIDHRAAPIAARAIDQNVDPVDLAVGAVVAVPLQLSPSGWAAALRLGLISSALAMGLVLAGVARVGPSRGAIVSTLEPLLATLWAALLLDERLAPLQLVGGALIVGALGVLALAPPAIPSSAHAKSAAG